MSFKLMAIDLDGTLLDSHKQISEVNQQTIRKAMKRGLRIVICSGRIFSGARIFAQQLGIIEPLIACNGAIIKEPTTGDILYHNYMRMEDCLKVIDLCHEEELYFHLYIGDTMFTEKLAFSSLFYWEKNKQLRESDQVDIRVVKDIKEFLNHNVGDISKIVAISENDEQRLRARKRISEIQTVGVTSSDAKNFEVVNVGVNKGKALKFLADKLNITKEEIIAIGDNENDCPMYEVAGLKVAMGNAEETIKELADYITLTNDENGVAETIERFVL